jgi:hypothetical protein
MVPSGLLRRVALLRADVSEEGIASIIRVKRIGQPGATPAATSNRSTLRKNAVWSHAPEYGILESGDISEALCFLVI